jgi:hypothetical protein
MPEYEYGRIAKLAESLAEADIAQETIAEIMTDGETIRKSTPPEKKAAWMKEAMQRMDELLDAQTRQAVREGCACCLGGKRQELAKAIAKRHETLEERIKAANETKMVFGHSVALQEDGRVLVCFSPEGLERYRCVCLPKAKEALPITYCYCCGGHVKHHLQTALGRELSVAVRSSALSSGGKLPCTFLLAMEDAQGA